MLDTIVAISTALSKGALSIVRLSGKEAIAIVSKVFKGKSLSNVESHTVHYGHIVDEEESIDEVLVTIFRSPKTYTREDVVEIGCHGGIYVTNRILELLIRKGCRLAEPGEFTKRAFLNGRIDLTQAEAVSDIIEAQTKISLQMAHSGLRGDIKRMIEAFQKELTAYISKIEVNIDYPEYEDEEGIALPLKEDIQRLINNLDNILENVEKSVILKEGVLTAIVGPPNVGKSSLLNALIKEEKAIVTEVPGTTRDIVEGQVNIGGIILNLIDTAGIRYTEDVIEKIGIEKAKETINKASLIIMVFDYNAPLTATDLNILNLTKERPRLIVINKNDLEPKIDLNLFDDYILMSAFNPEDITKLELKIKEVLNLSDLSSIDYTYIGNARQIAKIKQAKEALEGAAESLDYKQPIDIVNVDLMVAWRCFGDVLGRLSSESIIDEIFSKYCLGK